MCKCSSLCWVKALSVAAGLAAISLLALSIAIFSWVDIEDVQPISIPQDHYRSYSLHTSQSKYSQLFKRDVQTLMEEDVQEEEVVRVPRDVGFRSDIIDESSGEDDNMFIFGKMTTFPGMVPRENSGRPTHPPMASSSESPVETTTTQPPQRFPEGHSPKPSPPTGQHNLDPPRITNFDAEIRVDSQVGLWRICMQRSFIGQQSLFDKLGYNVTANSVSAYCWGMTPFDNRLPPSYEPLERVSTLIELIQDYHFNLPLLISLGILLLALLVTSGGMARNNAIMLAGAALYEFSGLILTVSLIWFYQTVYYCELPALPSTSEYDHYFGQEAIRYHFDGPKPYIRNDYGPAFWVAVSSFILINVAAAAGVATYKLAANKTTHRKLIRREWEAVRKANHRWLVTRL